MYVVSFRTLFSMTAESCINDFVVSQSIIDSFRIKS